MKSETNQIAIWAGLAVIALTSVLVFFGNADVEKRIEITIVYAAVMVILLMALLVIVEIAIGRIDISQLIAESGGGASMSRFQLLIFTLVIALCFVLLVVYNKKFPAIPREVLELLGISATTYAVSKGIQASGGLPSKPPPSSPLGGGRAPAAAPSSADDTTGHSETDRV
jgi:hypothetical protein